jgi:hypothetical protein
MGKAGRLIQQGLLLTWDGFWVVWLSNLLWLVFCLPVITAPLGFAGLYECAHGLAYGESITWRTFFAGIKRHLVSCYRWAAFNLLVILVLVFYAWFFSPTRGSLAGLAASLRGGVPIAVMLLWWVVNQFTFPFMLVQKKPSYLNALRNSLVIFIKWPGVVLGFTLFNLAVLFLCVWLRFPTIFIAGSLPALMACLCVKYTVDQTLDASPTIPAAG